MAHAIPPALSSYVCCYYSYQQSAPVWCSLSVYCMGDAVARHLSLKPPLTCDTAARLSRHAVEGKEEENVVLVRGCTLTLVHECPWRVYQQQIMMLLYFRAVCKLTSKGIYKLGVPRECKRVRGKDYKHLFKLFSNYNVW